MSSALIICIYFKKHNVAYWSLHIVCRIHFFLCLMHKEDGNICIRGCCFTKLVFLAFDGSVSIRHLSAGTDAVSY